jgi:PilZ domain
MTSEPPDGRAALPAGLSEDIFRRMLDEAREVGDKVLARLRELGGQLPEGTVEQVERLHYDPTHERRKTARVSDQSLPVAVQVAGQAGATNPTAIKDHSPTGLAVVLPCPAGVGTLLRVRMHPGDTWVTVEVKHCHKEGAGWVAGCELLGEQPPL